VPNMRSFILNGRMAGTANDLLRAVQSARSQAISLQRTVAVCASANPTSADPTCGGTFSGWIVFEDTNTSWQRESGERVIEARVAPDELNFVKDSDEDAVISFASTGFRTLTAGHVGATRILMCDSRGVAPLGDNSAARVLFIESTGRPRIERLQEKVSVVADDLGSCPP